MRVLLGAFAKTVVNGGISGLQFDLLDQFAALGSGQSGRGKLSPPPLGQQQVLNICGVVDRQLQGPRQRRKHFRRPIESCQTQETAEMDTGLYRLPVEVEMKLARL